MRAILARCLALCVCQLFAGCGVRARDVSASGVTSPRSAPTLPSGDQTASSNNDRSDGGVESREENPEAVGGDVLPPHSAERSFGENRRGGQAARDYAIRVGMGFSEDEEHLLGQAAESWARATGLPLHLRGGYGPLGNFHIAESIPVCGQRWVYDGYLGCYSPEFDNVVLNRHGLELEMQETEGLLFIVFVHEIGHWLGLEHARDGEDSVMLPDYPTLARRSGDLGVPSERDVRAVCSVNPCRI